jgi:hypothetical protein
MKVRIVQMKVRNAIRFWFNALIFHNCLIQLSVFFRSAALPEPLFVIIFRLLRRCPYKTLPVSHLRIKRAWTYVDAPNPLMTEVPSNAIILPSYRFPGFTVQHAFLSDKNAWPVASDT